jgi:hypothetical protein
MQNKTEHTKNEVLRYIYHETNESENDQIQGDIFANQEVEDMFYDFVSLKKDLDQVVLSPRKEVIDSILAFAKNAQQEEQTI